MSHEQQHRNAAAREQRGMLSQSPCAAADSFQPACCTAAAGAAPYCCCGTAAKSALALIAPAVFLSPPTGRMAAESAQFSCAAAMGSYAAPCTRSPIAWSWTQHRVVGASRGCGSRCGCSCNRALAALLPRPLAAFRLSCPRGEQLQWTCIAMLQQLPWASTLRQQRVTAAAAPAGGLRCAQALALAPAPALAMRCDAMQGSHVACAAATASAAGNMRCACRCRHGIMMPSGGGIEDWAAWKPPSTSVSLPSATLASSSASLATLARQTWSCSFSQASMRCCPSLSATKPSRITAAPPSDGRQAAGALCPMLQQLSCSLEVTGRQSSRLYHLASVPLVV